MASAAEIVALEKAIAAGVTEVAHGDKRVTYRSLAEMRQILAEEVAALAGRTRTRQIRVVTQGDKAL